MSKLNSLHHSRNLSTATLSDLTMGNLNSLHHENGGHERPHLTSNHLSRNCQGPPSIGSPAPQYETTPSNDAHAKIRQANSDDTIPSMNSLNVVNQRSIKKEPVDASFEPSAKNSMEAVKQRSSITNQTSENTIDLTVESSSSSSLSSLSESKEEEEAHETEQPKVKQPEDNNPDYESEDDDDDEEEQAQAVTNNNKADKDNNDASVKEIKGDDQGNLNHALLG
eukprot:scaffold3600_cov171-Amphora_coffeaeformis.AAC.3